MGKEKLKNKKGVTTITNILGKFERLNYEELKVLINGTVAGLVPVAVEQKKTTVLQVSFSDWTALSVYLSSAVDGEIALSFIMNTLNIAYDCERHGLRVDNLCWNPERIFVDQQGKIKMIYWPMTTLEHRPETPLSFYASFCGILTNSNVDRSIAGQYCQYFYQRDYLDLPGFFQMMTDIKEKWRTLRKKAEKQKTEQEESSQSSFHPDKQQTLIGGWLERVGKDQRVPLEQSTTLIGRDPGSCHLALPGHSCISRIHAMIENKDGQYYLTDLGSKNGTFLSGDRLHPNARVALDEGDRIKFYDVSFVFHKTERNKTISIHLMR